MTFNSLAFVILFFFCLFSYWRVPGRWRNQVLTAFSYVFYAWWDWRLLGLLIGITLVGFYTGTAMERSTQVGRRRLLLGTSVLTNLGALAVFKYSGFFVDEFADILDSVGLLADTPTINILLPIGVSFYTLQALGYTIDIYRERIHAEDRLFTFAAFIAFFPQLVAGPIERSENLMPQLRHRRRRLQHEDIEIGVGLIVLGLFKKIVLADSVARIVDSFWADPSSATVGAALAGVFGFSVQLYADFSGYSNIARGTARLLGIDLTVNFRQPYLAHNIGGFWRRWHISLSTWMRDYVYIPLGGSTHGPARTFAAIMITMALAGLWHGSSRMFVLWGLAHGLWVVGLHIVRRPRDHAPSQGQRVLSLTATYLGVTALWILFRSPDLSTAGDVVSALLGRGGTVGDGGDLMLVAGAWLTMIVVDVIHQRRSISRALLDRNPVIAGVGAGVVAVAVVVFSGMPVPFLYYQF